MGGSGGSYSISDPDKIKDQLRKSEEQTVDEEYEAWVNRFLSGLLPEYNDRDVEAINAHLEEIRNALGKEIEGEVDLLFGGSVAKHTYIDGLSDVDSLVILNNCELSEETPDVAKEYFADRLRERFPNTKIEKGTLAVTLHFSDVEVQLLPAVSCRSHVTIADQSGQQWSSINPREFQESLTEANQQVGRKVVPTIKLAKGVIANLPEKQRVSGYHAEALAIEAFRDYQGPRALKPMLRRFFSESAQRVRHPIQDQTGQSIHVDDYLGPANSLERRIVSDAFSRINRRMQNADSSSSREEWEKLFGV